MSRQGRRHSSINWQQRSLFQNKTSIGLDHDANLVDKQQVLEALESASDYEQGLSRLNDKQRGLIKKLDEAAGNFSKVAGKK